jgi:hypothetical protein
MDRKLAKKPCMTYYLSGTLHQPSLPIAFDFNCQLRYMSKHLDPTFVPTTKKIPISAQGLGLIFPEMRRQGRYEEQNSVCYVLKY